MNIIDLNTWDRTIHYNFFKRMDYPHYNIGANFDITNFLNKIKEKQIPFYYAMIYAATYGLNQVEEFRYRIRGEQVILHDIIHPSFTDMSEGTDLFKMVTVSMEPTIFDFTKKPRKRLLIK